MGSLSFSGEKATVARFLINKVEDIQYIYCSLPDKIRGSV